MKIKNIKIKKLRAPTLRLPLTISGGMKPPSLAWLTMLMPSCCCF